MPLGNYDETESCEFMLGMRKHIRCGMLFTRHPIATDIEVLNYRRDSSPTNNINFSLTRWSTVAACLLLAATRFTAPMKSSSL